MATAAPRLERLALRALAIADATANRLYQQRFNPLYQTGTIAVALYVVLLATGLWLLLFYRIGEPWESVARVTADRWTGNWVRGVHRYASDLAVAATLLHAVRMFAQGRSWGPRTLAWISGSILLLLLFVCGWTGYVMVWDAFGYHLAREGARLLDALPVLSEPTSRAFTGEQPLPTAFFFLNLFAHVGIPLGMALLFWLHIKRLARPRLLPPRPVVWTIAAVLVVASFLVPLPISPKADPLALPLQVRGDLFFAFWLPALRPGVAAAWLTALAAAALVLSVPALARRARTHPAPSSVDESLCTGCVQCSLDCPYGAITMVEREGGPSPLVACVDPGLCVSCGICAGSCAPMGVGPAGRTGRDQMSAARAFMSDPGRRAGEVMVIACEHGAGASLSSVRAAGGTPYPVACAGSVHTSVIELMVRAGAGGVLVLACPARDCRHREGPQWLVERVYHEREAELQARVDRARVRVEYVSAGERTRAGEVIRAFAADLRSLGPAAEAGPAPVANCGLTPAEVDR